jgi:hypothetical protein
LDIAIVLGNRVWAGRGRSDQCTGPGGVLLASWRKASVIRRQVAGPLSVAAGREFISSSGAFERPAVGKTDGDSGGAKIGELVPRCQLRLAGMAFPHTSPSKSVAMVIQRGKR